MESAKYSIKEAVQAIQELDLGEGTCNINQYIKKRMHNNDISEVSLRNRVCCRLLNICFNVKS